MTAIHYQITLLEPTIFDAPEGEPNSAVTYPFVPGSAIRGRVIGAYLRANGLSELNAADEVVQRLFFDGRTRFLNANLLDPVTGQRSLPPPLSWQRRKGDKRIVYDSVIDKARPNEPMKSIKGHFAVIQGDKVSLAEVSHTLNIHTQRPRSGQQTGDSRRDSLLFRYEALSQGQIFAGSILFDEVKDRDVIAPLLPGTVTLGGARSAGYGRAVIKIAEDDFSEPVGYYEGNMQVITLLSDVILRDNNGQYSPTLSALLTSVIPPDVSLQLSDVIAVLDSTMAGGFNRKWNLPLPKTPALCAGSVLVLPAGTLSSDQLDRLIWFGIGERRAEGFGRVAVNWQLEPKYDVIRLDEKQAQEIRHQQAKDAITSVEIPTLSEAQDAADMLIRRIDNHIDRNNVERSLARGVYESENQIVSNPPSRTLIGRLRREISAALRTDPPDSQVLLWFVESIKDKHADKQFQNARVEGRPMSKWLDDMIREAGQQPPGDVLRFVNLVLERIQKESKQETQA